MYVYIYIYIHIYIYIYISAGRQACGSPPRPAAWARRPLRCFVRSLISFCRPKPESGSQKHKPKPENCFQKHKPKPENCFQKHKPSYLILFCRSSYIFCFVRFSRRHAMGRVSHTQKFVLRQFRSTGQSALRCAGLITLGGSKLPKHRNGRLMQLSRPSGYTPPLSFII